jgi:hypothetical protein
MRSLIQLLATTIFLTACATEPRAPAIQPSSPVGAPLVTTQDLYGEWEGNLVMLNAKLPDIPKGFRLRLHIDEDGLAVEVYDKDQWRQAKPGHFVGSMLGPSAVYYALDSGDDEDGTWVESWTFSLTVSESGTLQVEWSRVVNNVDIARPSGKFHYSGAGTLHRPAAGA